MLLSKIKTVYESNTGDRVCQGDILRDVGFSCTYHGKEDLETKVMLNYAVVMSQDCDLEHDYKARGNEEEKNNDKFLPTILLCPAYTSGAFFEGKHIDGWQMRTFKSGEQDKLKSNNEYNRYHFIAGDSKLSIPDLIIDFKHFYTVPSDIIQPQYRDAYLATVNELFRERLSQRFVNYLSRFGLPELPEINREESY